MLNKQQLKKSIAYKANPLISQKINGTFKSSQTSTDSTIDYVKINDSKKAKSTSNIFDESIANNYNISHYSGHFKSSLKLCVESMVFSQQLQMACELLLLSTSIELWPLSLHHLNKVQRDFNKFSDCHEELINFISVLKEEINQFENCIIGGSNATVTVDEKIGHINDIVTTAVSIMELGYQSVYTISSTQPSWKRNQPGVLDRKTIISAIDNVELNCFRLREILLRISNNDSFNFSNQELQEVMIFSCSNFSSALTYLAICCRTAAANVDISIKSSQISKKNSDKRSEENLFQLAMSSVSKSSQCMLASVKNYVNEPNIENRFIMESFTNSVSSAVKALAAMATSSKFVGYPSLLPVSIKMMRNTICGSCMSLISPIIQLLQTTAALYSVNISQPPRIFDQILDQSDQTMSDLVQRAITCVAAIRAAMSHLQQTLNLYQNY